MILLIECKFTPLGFETLMLPGAGSIAETCKFTPLGFETLEFQANKQYPIV